MLMKCHSGCLNRWIINLTWAKITSSTVVEYSTHNPKIEGSNLTARTGREKMAKKLLKN
jgi:hypothetical protein